MRPTRLGDQTLMREYFLQVEQLELGAAASARGKTRWYAEGSENDELVEVAVAKTFVRKGWFCGPRYFLILDALLLALRFSNFRISHAEDKKIAQLLLLEGLVDSVAAEARRDLRRRLKIPGHGGPAPEQDAVAGRENAALDSIVSEMRERTREDVASNIEKALLTVIRKEDQNRRAMRLPMAKMQDHALAATGIPLEQSQLCDATMLIFDHLSSDKIIDLHLGRSLRKAREVKALRGWPDLMRFKDGALVFMEVKSPTDKLSADQVEIAKNICQLSIDMVELRVIPLG